MPQLSSEGSGNICTPSIDCEKCPVFKSDIRGDICPDEKDIKLMKKNQTKRNKRFLSY